MAALPPWKDLVAGRNCPFCLPRSDHNEYWQKIADLGISSLYLDRNQTYRGYSILVFNKSHALGLEQLDGADYAAFTKDLQTAAKAIHKATGADHMNYATLGNVIPHLHYHIIPRYENAPRWGAPVWETRLETMKKTTLSDDEFSVLLALIRDCLS